MYSDLTDAQALDLLKNVTLPITNWAAKRIEELEAEVSRLRVLVHPCDCGICVQCGICGGFTFFCPAHIDHDWHDVCDSCPDPRGLSSEPAS